MRELKKTRFRHTDSPKPDDSGKKHYCRPRKRVISSEKKTYEQSMGHALADLMVDRGPVKILNMQTGAISCYPSNDLSLCAIKIHSKPENQDSELSEPTVLKSAVKK